MAKPKISGMLKVNKLPNNFFSAFNKEVLLLANKTNRKFANDAVKEAKDIIRKQRYHWKPLKDRYKKAKEEKGLDTRILMATRDYVNKGIGVWEKEGFIFAGPKPGVHKGSGLPYSYLARIHEFGTWTIPARPLWRPLLSSMMKRRKAYKDSYRDGTRKIAFRLKKLNRKLKKI